jgi:hypothetical protein
MTSYHVQCGIRVHGTIRPYWAERDDFDDSKTATVIDIARCQLENVLRVIKIDLDEGTSEDVSEDIALDVIQELDDVPRSEGLQNFLDTHAPEAYREFCVERDAAWGRAVSRLEAAE